MVSWLSAGWVGEMIYFLWGGNWVGKWELKVWDSEDVSEGGMCPRAEMRCSEVLVCWTDGAWHLTVSRFGLQTGRGFWRRSIDWLVSCVYM